MSSVISSAISSAISSVISSVISSAISSAVSSAISAATSAIGCLSGINWDACQVLRSAAAAGLLEAVSTGGLSWGVLEQEEGLAAMQPLLSQVQQQ